MNRESVNQVTRERVAELYKQGKSTDIILISQHCLEQGSAQGFNFHMMISRLKDLGVKPAEIDIALPLALHNIPESQLNEIDRLAKILSDQLINKFHDSLTASSKSVNACKKEEPVQTWLFGEMQLDLSRSLDEIYTEAFAIAENCGYMVARTADTIQIYGQDCPDEFTVVNTIYFDNGKVSRVLKHTLKGEKTISSKEVEIES